MKVKKFKARLCCQCGKKFIPRGPNTRACSKKCVETRIKKYHKDRYLSRRKNRTFTCVICRKEVTHTPAVGKCTVNVCSEKCRTARKVLACLKWKAKNPEKARAHYLKVKDTEVYAEKRCEYHKNRRRIDLKYRLMCAIRTAVKGRIKLTGPRTCKLVGYTAEDLKKHIESFWLPGMSWKNYGRYGWHIDHIKPLSKFNFFNLDGSFNEKEVRSAMSLKNLQPLWAADNLKKSNKFQEAFPWR